VHQDTIENVEDKRLIIDTLLSELTNETTKISFKKLLTELQFVEEMDAGHSWLGEMVTKYMGSIDIARELMGDDKFDKEAYKALQQFAGVKGRGQGEKARTLPMIAKYNNAISESDVLEYVTALLQTVQNDSNYSVPVVSHVPSNVAPITFLNHPQRYEPKQASEPVPTLPIDLWAAAVHNKPAPTSDVERAVEHVFDTAVKNNQLKRSEAFFLKDRLFSGDNRHTLDQQEEETLNKIAGLMQVLNANVYSRLDESPEAKKYLRDFTTVSKTLGVTTVGEITQRANKDSRIKLRESTIARKIVGAIQVVLEDSRES
jgi:hypothetical protein